MARICKKISTLGPIGYLKGSGTWATLVSLPFVWWLSSSLTLSFIVASIFALMVSCSVSLWKESDPSEVVADEVIGFFVAMFAIPQTAGAYLLGFVLFRFFDIFKIMGIRRVEKLPGAVGVVMDDVVAGLYTNLLLHLCFWLLS